MASKSTLAIEWPVFRPRGWGKSSTGRALDRPWFGLDTERDAITGKFVCGWISGETTARFGSIADLAPGTYWVWNLPYDFEGLLRDLELPEGWAAREDGAEFPLLDGEAVYYHGKQFRWKRPSGVVRLIEAASFFGRQPLSAIGSKGNVDASKMSLERYTLDSEYRSAVDLYCAQDARIVYDAMMKLDGSVTGLGITLGATPGATARRFMSSLPAFPGVLWETHKPFLRSYCGGRFEVTKRGVLTDVKQYDLVSAYPWALTQCPWLTDSSYQRMTRRISDNALYGSYEVSFSYDDYLGIAPRWKKGIRVYSKAEENTWLTRPEVLWLRDRGARLEIKRGVEVFDPNASDLWKQIILPLFNAKARYGKDFMAWGPKIVLNSQYGILIQLIRRSGEWKPIAECLDPVDFAGVLGLEAAPDEFEAGSKYAPLYAGNLTALTRLRLLDAALDMGPANYAGGHTDSVLGTGRLTKGIGSGLGDWKLESEVPRAEICKTGMYALGDKIKIRGITRKGTASMLWKESFIRNARIGIKRAASWDDVSVIVPKEVANNYEVENKRRWLGPVTRGLIAMDRFVDSEALSMVAV